MLLQFNFKNYKSFRDDTTLDFTATKITELNHHVISIGQEKVLPVAAIFGANASGKSNVLEAFRYMLTYVTDSFTYGGDYSNKKVEETFFIPTPFLFDDKSKEADSTFEVHFIDSEANGAKTYNYGFVVGSNGVKEEWLNYKAKTSRGDYRRIFHRNGSEIDLEGIPAKKRENILTSLEDESLIVSLGAKLKIDNLKHIREWFQSNAFVDFGSPIENYWLSSLLPDGFVDDKKVQENVVKYLSAFDPSIVGFDVEMLGIDKNANSRIRIDAIHKMVDSDEVSSIRLKLESAGTLKMFSLYPFLQQVLETGGVLFIDELNSRLHPLLVRTFLIAFFDSEKNKNHAQLVFTSHETWLLSRNILRRDEIWFAEKDSDGVSSLYSLADFVDNDGAKIRKDESYVNNYLLGKYGAIPVMKGFNIFEEE